MRVFVWGCVCVEGGGSHIEAVIKEMLNGRISLVTDLELRSTRLIVCFSCVLFYSALTTTLIP